MQYEEGLGVKPVGVQSIQLLPNLLQLGLAALWKGEPGAHEQEVWVPPIPQMSFSSSKKAPQKNLPKTTTPSSPWRDWAYLNGPLASGPAGSCSSLATCSSYGAWRVELGCGVGTKGGPYRYVDFGMLSVPALLLHQLPLCLLSLFLSQ